MTLGGLRRNREAFSLIKLTVDELLRIEQYWNAWLLQSNALLKDIDNIDVIRKATDNQNIRRTRTRRPDEEGVIIDEIPNIG